MARNTTGSRLRASAPATSLVLMREPSRLARRSRYNLTNVRNNMKPSVTVSRKISVETAQKTKVCSTLAGPYSPKVKETCQTTSVSRIAIRARPDQKRYRFRIALLKLYGLLNRRRQATRYTFTHLNKI